jgi:hypothetical protein
VLNKSVSDFGHDYINTFWQLSQYVENVVNYIAGYISKKISKEIDYSVCLRHIIGKDMSFLSKSRIGELTTQHCHEMCSICT